MDELLAKIEDRELSGLEILLSIAVALLGGIIIGIIFSPKGARSYGSNNGNNSGNNTGNNNGIESAEDEIAEW